MIVPRLPVVAVVELTRSSRSHCYDRAGADGVIADPLGPGGRQLGVRAELIMKMIFIKVRPCCEAAPRAAVSMPKMRRSTSKAIRNSGKKKDNAVASRTDPGASTVSLFNANFRRLG